MKKLKHILILTAIIGFAHSASANSNFTLRVAVGSVSPKGKLSPMILMNNTENDKWLATSNINNLPSFEQSELEDIKCQNNICTAIGWGVEQNALQESKIKPLIVQSFDNGATWAALTSITNFPSLNKTYLKTIACYNKNCIAGGIGEGGVFTAPFAMAVSEDSGFTWSYAYLDRGIGYYKKIWISQIISDGKNWHAIGDAIPVNTNSYTAFMASSSDYGRHWTSDVIDFVLPGIKSALLSSAVCNTDYCIAVGSYNTGNMASNDWQALMLVGDNKTHKARAVINLPQSKNLPFISLEQINCANSLCVVAGEYRESNSKIYKPYILVSEDKGKSWVIAKDKTGLKYNSEIFVGPHALACANKYCLIAEHYGNESLLRVSKISSEWSFTLANKGLSDVSNMHVRSLHCDAKFCEGTGEYTDADTHVTQPLILTSLDEGQSWAHAKNFQNLPNPLGYYNVAAISSVKVN